MCLFLQISCDSLYVPIQKHQNSSSSPSSFIFQVLSLYHLQRLIFAEWDVLYLQLFQHVFGAYAQKCNTFHQLVVRFVCLWHCFFEYTATWGRCIGWIRGNTVIADFGNVRSDVRFNEFDWIFGSRFDAVYGFSSIRSICVYFEWIGILQTGQIYHPNRWNFLHTRTGSRLIEFIVVGCWYFAYHEYRFLLCCTSVDCGANWLLWKWCLHRIAVFNHIHFVHFS